MILIKIKKFNKNIHKVKEMQNKLITAIGLSFVVTSYSANSQVSSSSMNQDATNHVYSSTIQAVLNERMQRAAESAMRSKTTFDGYRDSTGGAALNSVTTFNTYDEAIKEAEYKADLKIKALEAQIAQLTNQVEQQKPLKAWANKSYRLTALDYSGKGRYKITIKFDRNGNPFGRVQYSKTSPNSYQLNGKTSSGGDAAPINITVQNNGTIRSEYSLDTTGKFKNYSRIMEWNVLSGKIKRTKNTRKRTR